MPGPPKGHRYGGRKAGTPNKETVRREELARAELERALKAAKAAGTSPRVALDDLYRVTTIAEGIASKLQPKSIEQDAVGQIVIKGGDVKLFGEWYDRLFRCIELTIKYQLPQMKAVDAPTPPPDPGELERSSRKRFTLRVFEGGRAVRPMTSEEEE